MVDFNSALGFTQRFLSADRNDVLFFSTKTLSWMIILFICVKKKKRQVDPDCCRMQCTQCLGWYRSAGVAAELRHGRNTPHFPLEHVPCCCCVCRQAPPCGGCSGIRAAALLQRIQNSPLAPPLFRSTVPPRRRHQRPHLATQFSLSPLRSPGYHITLKQPPFASSSRIFSRFNKFTAPSIYYIKLFAQYSRIKWNRQQPTGCCEPVLEIQEFPPPWLYSRSGNPLNSIKKKRD